MIDYKCNVSDNVISIYDSYLISKFDFPKILGDIKQKYPQCNVTLKRSKFSLCMEWTVHNFLYMINYKRSRTKDVDLDYPCDKPEWLYCICGLLTWIFIK